MSASLDPVAPEQVFDWLDSTPAAKNLAALKPRKATDNTIDLASTDYLGLACDKRVAGAAAAASLRWGSGARGSRFFSGTLDIHTELEHELARFTNNQACVVFGSSFAANSGALTALSGAGSAIITDKYVHSSLVDGCRGSRADIAVADYQDLTAMEKALATRKNPRALVVVDSVNGATGESYPLGDIQKLCLRYGAGLFIHDSESFGVAGEGGRGLVHQAGLSGAPHVVTAIALSHSLGAQGGAILGPRRVIKHVIAAARSFSADSALAPGNSAAALAALGVLREEQQLPKTVVDIAESLTVKLKSTGLSVYHAESTVVCIVAADDVKQWAERCANLGVRVGYVPAPTSPDGKARLRLTIHANLSESDVDKSVQVIRETANSAVSQ